MGTSDSFEGQKDRGNKYLPDWFEPITELDANKWENAKYAMSRYLSSNKSNPSNAIYRYCIAGGGNSNLSKSALTSKKALTALANLISNINTLGVEKTLQQLGIDYINKKPIDVLIEFTDTLQIDGGIKEDAVVRESLLVTIENICVDVETYDKLYDVLNDEKNLIRIFIVYLSTYISKRLFKDLRSRFNKLSDPKKVFEKEEECKGFIKNFVDRIIDGEKTKKLLVKPSDIIDEIYIDCYKALERLI